MGPVAAEMYGYSMAAAHLELPHGRVDHLMVSNTGAFGEGWSYVDALFTHGLDVCQRGDLPQHSIEHPLPTFLHFCQGYRIDTWFFHKRRVPMVKNDIRWPQPTSAILSCDHPLPAAPPQDLPSRLWQRKPKNETITLTSTQARRQAFMLCAVHHGIAADLGQFKRRVCSFSGDAQPEGLARDFRVSPPVPI